MCNIRVSVVGVTVCRVSGCVKVHTLTVTLDGQLLSPVDGFLIRKGPGNCYFDFAQQIMFGGHEHKSRSHDASLSSGYEPSQTQSM